MASIIPLHGTDHHQTQLLLPWFATGRLDPGEQALVEGHLRLCTECQADLALERRVAMEVASLPIAVEEEWAPAPGGWRGERPVRIPATGARGPLAAAWRDVGRQWRGAAPWLSFALAAQAAVIALLGALALTRVEPAGYHALAGARGAMAGNGLVIFQPQITEAALREALRASHARLVDGPTAADAYVIHVPAAERANALARLRGRADVVLAEPIDASGPP